MISFPLNLSETRRYSSCASFYTTGQSPVSHSLPTDSFYVISIRPDHYAQKILLRLREAAREDTQLVLADWVLPLACVDDFGFGVGEQQSIEGVEKMLAPAPLLPNLGKASANAYWMDLTVCCTLELRMIY